MNRSDDSLNVQPVISFPPRLRSASGRLVRPGATVEILTGPAAGMFGEVVAWRGADMVEVLLEQSAADDDVEMSADELVEVPVSTVELRPHRLSGTATMTVEVVATEDSRVTLIHPVGGQDVIALGDLGPFPTPDGFSTTRETQRKVAARAWGAACLEAIAELPLAEQEQLVAAHLDAPLLRRVLDEGLLPSKLWRLVLIVTDQVDAPHVDDTAAFGELLRLWVAGTATTRRRVVERVESVVLQHAPHRFDFVTAQLDEHLARWSLDSDEVVVVQAGGTPSMSFGALTSALTSGAGIPVRHLQVPYGQPVVEVDFPATIRRAQAVATVTALYETGAHDLAAQAADQLGLASIATAIRDAGDRPLTQTEWVALTTDEGRQQS